MRYWPDDVGEYGPFHVIIQKREVFDKFTIRKFIVRKVFKSIKKIIWLNSSDIKSFIQNYIYLYQNLPFLMKLKVNAY